MKKRRTTRKRTAKVAKAAPKKTARKAPRKSARKAPKRAARKAPVARKAASLSVPQPRGLGLDEKQLVRLTLWASVAIIAIVLMVLFFSSYSFSGQYVSVGAYTQYEPSEICALNDCEFTGELTSVTTKSPYRTPEAGCLCQGRLEYYPLLVRSY